MNNQLRRVITRLGLLCALVAICIFGVTDRTVYALSDTDFFAAQGQCDDTAYAWTRDTCMNDPNGPDDETCRMWAAFAFGECLGSIGPPSYGLDFCSMARGRRDLCANLYGVYAPVLDFPAYGECYDASGVSACE